LIQALLLLAFGAIFLFTSARMKVKRRVLWLFGLSALVHAAGLSARGHYPVLDNILLVSGTVMFSLMAYMCYAIYVDLTRSRRRSNRINGAN